MQKGQALMLVLVAIVIIAAVAGGAYYLGRSTTSKLPPAPVSQTPQPIPDASREPTDSAEIKKQQSGESLKDNNRTIVKVFFNNKKLANDPDFIYCDKVFSVNRSISYTKAVAAAALNEWLKGPTAEEEGLGYSGGTKGDVSINSVKIIDGQAYVDVHFSGDNDSWVAARKYLSGTCGISSFLSQIEETVEQFPSVSKKKTVFSVDGSQEYFNGLVINP